MCCNPAKGRVEFEDGWLIISIFITMDEMKACQQTRTKIKNPKKTKKQKNFRGSFSKISTQRY
jgi:hypothetical protein